MKPELEELEPRTPATSLPLFADPLSLVEGDSAGTLLLAGMTDPDGNSNPSYYSAMVKSGHSAAALLPWRAGVGPLITAKHQGADPRSPHEDPDLGCRD